MKLPKNFKKFLATEASAGTGKTFKLSVRYVALLLAGAAPESIWAITFTNKAANEMEARVMSIIYNPSKHKAEISAISKEMGLAESTVRNKVYKLKKTFSSSVNHIMTIDSFTNQILRVFGVQVGMSSDFDIGEMPVDKEVDEFLKYIKASRKVDMLIELTEHTKDRLEEIVDGFKSISRDEKEIAAAVSKYLIDNCDVNYTREIEEIEASIEQGAKKILDILNLNPNSVDRQKNPFEFKNIQSMVGASVFSKESLDYSTYKKVYTVDLDDAFRELKSLVGSWYKYKEMLFIKNMIELYGEYKESSYESKKEKGILTFDDISSKVFDIMTDRDLDFIKFKLDSKINHMLVDEFQDTSWVQYNILLPIINEIVSGVGSEKFRTFFFVGDTKQSIYRFRGGNPDLFSRAKIEHKMETDTLDVNFRSSVNVVEFTNSIFLEVYAGLGAQAPTKDAKRGYVEVGTFDDPYSALTDKVDKLLEAKVAPKDIAILVFTNNDVLQVSNILNEKYPELSVVTDTSASLLGNRAVSAIIELLRFQQTGEQFYLHSFCGIIGENPVGNEELFGRIKEVLVESAPLFDYPARYVKEIVSKLGLFNGDVNIIKFIEVLMRFDTVEELFMKINTIKESIVNPEDVDGIRVMTVHKSKGLEFGSVIIPEKTQYKKQDHRQLFYEYNNQANVVRVWHKFKERENFDSDYMIALNGESDRIHNDIMNLLYVATTRAKDNMIIMKLPKGSRFDKLPNMPTHLEEGKLK